MKAVEFLGRRAEFEHRFRRALALAAASTIIGLLAAALVWISGPARLVAAVPRWMRADLPFWLLGLAVLGPLGLALTHHRRLRRAGLTCPHCGQSLAKTRGEIVTETTACPRCRERLIEDGRRPDFDWAWLEPVAVGPFRRPRWRPNTPRPDLRRRLDLFHRRSRRLVFTTIAAAGLYATLLASHEAWAPRTVRGFQAAQERFEDRWSSPVPGSARAVLGVAGLLLAPLFLGPWFVLRRHGRLLRELHLRCGCCSAPLPPRAGLAVALGRCGDCGAALDSEGEVQSAPRALRGPAPGPAQGSQPWNPGGHGGQRR